MAEVEELKFNHFNKSVKREIKNIPNDPPIPLPMGAVILGYATLTSAASGFVTRDGGRVINIKKKYCGKLT